jgi:hypothetical protein
MAHSWTDKTKTPDERSRLIMESPYLFYSFTNGKAGMFAENDVLNGTVDLYGRTTGASLRDILMPIAKNRSPEVMDSFKDYVVAMIGREYAKRGLDYGLSRNEIAAAIRKNRSPEFKRALEELTAWHDRRLRLYVDAGLMSQETFDAIRDSRDYYNPTLRILEGLSDHYRVKRGGKALYRRKGGTQDIEDPIVAAVESCIKQRNACIQGRLLQLFVKLHDRAKAEKDPHINLYMVEVPNQVKRDVVWADKIKDQLGRLAISRFGADPANVRAAQNDTWTEEIDVFSTAKYHGKDNIASIYVLDEATGEMKLRSFEFTNPDILDMFRGYTGAAPRMGGILGGAAKVARGLATMTRLGATVYKPAFSLVANVWRDLFTAFIAREHNGSWWDTNSMRGLIDAAFNTDMAKEYRRLGGGMSSFFDGDMRVSSKRLAAQATEVNKFRAAWKKGAFKIIGDILSTPEEGMRIGSMRGAMNALMADGISQDAAAYLARIRSDNATLNFGLAGKQARIVNQYIPFFNAGIRGLDQLAHLSGAARPLPWQDMGEGVDPTIEDPVERERAAETKSRWQHARTLMKRGLVTLTATAIAAYLRNLMDDKRRQIWEELKPEHKWGNIIWITGDGTIVRLPVPFELGVIFQSLPVATMEAIRTNDAKPIREVADYFLQMMPARFDSLHQFVRSVSGGLAPVADIGFNKKWNGQDLVPGRLQRKDKRDWVADDTTFLAKTMGEFLGIAPIHLDHLMHSVTGGSITSLMRDWEAVSSKRGALGVNGDWSRLPVVGRLFLAPFSSSRLPNDFYRELDDLTAKHNSGRTTLAELGKLKAMEDVHEKVLHENSSMRRAVLAREDISAEEAKKLADGYAKDTIDTIRTFNGYAKDHDFRAEGIRSAVSTLSNPGATDTSIQRDRKILQDVSLSEAQNALRVYGKSKGWSRETVNKRLRFLGRRW